jgi:hypothetical protein
MYTNKYTKELKKIVDEVEKDKKISLTANATPNEIADHIKKLQEVQEEIAEAVTEIEHKIFCHRNDPKFPH